MSQTREEYEKDRAKAGDLRLAGQRPIFEAAKMAALSAKYVTGDQYWDRFLSLLQARLEEATAKRDEAMRRFQDENEIDPDKLIDQKLAVRLFSRDIETLEFVMALPKTVMEQGDQASKLLGSIRETSL